MLLRYLVEKAMEIRQGAHFLLDSRCAEVFSHIPESNKTILTPGIRARRRFYSRNRDRFSGVLCFGNIPPPCRLAVPVYTYLHNPLLLATPDGYPLRQKLSKLLKTTFIRLHLGNTDGIFVQTGFMARMLMENWHYPEEKIHLFPFFDGRRFTPLHDQEKNANEYLFINDGNPHKNHINLLRAWALVNQKQPGWRLNLTVSGRFPEVVARIEEYRNQGVNILNHGFTDPVNVYSRCRYLIYPSLTESFGLGLIEGTLAGLQVICSDLPYAHSVLEPSAVFDPLNPEKMAAVILANRTENENFRPTRLITRDCINDMLAMWNKPDGDA